MLLVLEDSSCSQYLVLLMSTASNESQLLWLLHLCDVHKPWHCHNCKD